MLKSSPFYLKGYEAQYHINPRATAIEWHRYAKWGFSDSSFFIYGCIGRSVFLLLCNWITWPSDLRPGLSTSNPKVICRVARTKIKEIEGY
jgi:hypothetical protein